MKRTTEGYPANSVYVTISGEVVNRRSVLIRNLVLNGKESATNPLHCTYTQTGSSHCKRRHRNIKTT